jgi:hypothetical protein
MLEMHSAKMAEAPPWERLDVLTGMSGLSSLHRCSSKSLLFAALKWEIGIHDKTLRR